MTSNICIRPQVLQTLLYIHSHCHNLPVRQHLVNTVEYPSVGPGLCELHVTAQPHLLIDAALVGFGANGIDSVVLEGYIKFKN